MELKKLQKKIAEYPKKIMTLEKIYDSIPSIKELSKEMEKIERSENTGEELRRNLKLFKSYRISLDAVYENYLRIKNDIESDIEKMKEFEPNESVRLSIIQAEQLILSINTAAGALEEEKENLEFSIKKLQMTLKGSD
ncbi:MAG: hypothetical protein K5894_06160 [Lachnospiraceae bacterium]|nr:hypothetical protein [Lachnospiraceae bacterium]